MTWLDSMGYNKTGVSYDGSGDDGCPWDWKTGYPANDNQDTVRARSHTQSVGCTSRH
jgi:hypothetical protein